MPDPTKHSAPSRRVRRVELTGDDVDTITKVAIAGSRDVMRPALTSVHCQGGLAFASDSYRLAFGEVDCDDISIPIRAVPWLPFDGGVITACGTRVMWEPGVGGEAWPWDGGLEAIAKIASEPPTTYGRPDRELTDVEHRVPYQWDDRSDLVLVGDDRRYAAVNEGFLRPLLKVLDPLYLQVGLAERTLWLWDQEITCILMPVRLANHAWTWHTPRLAGAA